MSYFKSCAASWVAAYDKSVSVYGGSVPFAALSYIIAILSLLMVSGVLVIIDIKDDRIFWGVWLLCYVSIYKWADDVGHFFNIALREWAKGEEE